MSSSQTFPELLAHYNESRCKKEFDQLCSHIEVSKERLQNANKSSSDDEPLEDMMLSPEELPYYLVMFLYTLCEQHKSFPHDNSQPDAVENANLLFDLTSKLRCAPTDKRVNDVFKIASSPCSTFSSIKPQVDDLRKTVLHLRDARLRMQVAQTGKVLGSASMVVMLSAFIFSSCALFLTGAGLIFATVTLATIAVSMPVTRKPEITDGSLRTGSSAASSTTSTPSSTPRPSSLAMA